MKCVRLVPPFPVWNGPEGSLGLREGGDTMGGGGGRWPGDWPIYIYIYIYIYLFNFYFVYLLFYLSIYFLFISFFHECHIRLLYCPVCAYI